MISRREAVLGAAATLWLNYSLFAQDDDKEWDWKKALRDAIDNKSPVTLGRCLPPPDDISWKEANNILNGAPSKVPPYLVANYFVDAVPAKYQRAWPELDIRNCTYANPVIVMFFLATSRNPDGDTTPWCSAFVNWCLHRAGMTGTSDAGSQSFANWGQEVWKKTDGSLPSAARTGDIAVFQDIRKPDHGHVCFFKKISALQPMSIEVLGGNQLVGRNPNRLHMIDVATFRVGGNLELRSIRTVNGLRVASR